MISNITIEDVKNYLRISESTDADNKLLSQMMSVAKDYIKDYTGVEDVDSKEAFSIVYYALIQDMWDNRSLYVSEGKVSEVVGSILGMYSMNLL
jgi:uncharacterized phage protein (predicted DNA packaging)